MYTPEMASAFKSIVPPKDFGVTLYDNNDFITMQIDPNELVDISEEQANQIVKYVNDVKKTLESFGVVVFIVRDSINKEEND